MDVISILRMMKDKKGDSLTEKVTSREAIASKNPYTILVLPSQRDRVKYGMLGIG